MSFLKGFLIQIERKLVIFAFIIVCVLYIAYMQVHQPDTRTALDFFEQLIPNLAATFVLFVGSYLFLKEIDQLRKNQDQETLSNFFAAKVLKGLHHNSMRIGLPARHFNRQQAATDVLLQSTEIWLMGKTLSFFVSQNKNLLIAKLQGGATLRLLVLAADDSELLHIMSRTSSQTPQQLALAIDRTVSALRLLKSEAETGIASGGTLGQIELKFSKAPFNNGYTFVDPDAKNHLARVYIEYFGLSIDLSERLSAVLPELYDPDGFSYHRKQFEKLWNQGIQCTL